MVPVAECRMPTVTSVSVTARPVVLTAEVAGACANDVRGSIVTAGMAAIPINNLRRSGDNRPLLASSDMSTPLFVRGHAIGAVRMARICAAQAYARSRILHRKIPT